jgi:uncharacterized membrane protein YfcA
MGALFIAAAVAVTVGAVLQSATGFGFALVAAPLLFPTLGPQDAIGTLLVLACVGSLLILAAERRRPRPLGREAATIIAASLPGAIGGVVVLRSLSAVTLQYAVTVSVIVALLIRWKGAQDRGDGRQWWSAPAAGIAAGALTTSTNASGPPLLLHLTGRGTEPACLRDTINVCYLGLSAVSAGALWLTHTSGAVPNPWVLAALVPLVVVGNLVGRPLFGRLAGGGAYEPVLSSILVVAVVVGLATAIV